MTKYVSSALFVHTPDTGHFSQRLQENAQGVAVTPVLFDDLMQKPMPLLEGVEHIVVSGGLGVIKAILRLSVKYGFSVGLVPAEGQKTLVRFYDLPKDSDSAIDLALQADGQVMDLILCNDNVMLFKAIVGRIPALDMPADLGPFKITKMSLQRLSKMQLHGFDIQTNGEKQLKTAACGCMIIQRHRGISANKLMPRDSSFNDGMISTVVSAPFSVLQYLKFLRQLLRPVDQRGPVPATIGYIKSKQISIDSETEKNVYIDGKQATQTPLHCETLPEAIQINIGKGLREKTKAKPAREQILVDNLPQGKELVKARRNNKVPLFSYASEDRFKDLFISLRDDAKIDMNYLVLMVLSTLLATLGLYLDSASVIIGAMLLAPLMAPIVSMAMGILRNDIRMMHMSRDKIIVGIFIALLASTLVTLLFPHKPVTGEMQARLNPTLLDLGVAIISGIAAAYSKSFKEIVQSLAGVAIAVALVPPLSVAGIGIGRLDLNFFGQAFLLFTTNLIGIIMAANFIFRFLGYSAAIRNKRNFGLVLVSSVLIAIPLYLSYNQIVEKRIYEKSWQKERFLVNGKYIIVKKASVNPQGNKQVVLMDILARDLLTRGDLTAFKHKVETNFDKKPTIRANIIYIP